MKNNETGEFELVVGDRHLLIAFFIVVLLCGVAFAMGYVVGQNVPRSGKVTAETVPPIASSNSAADARPQPLPPAPAPATETPSSAAPTARDGAAAAAEGAPQPTTQPSQGSQPTAPAQSTAPATASGTGLVAPEDLPPGNFWQVIAVAQPQAEAIRTTLKDHNFAVILSPGPKGLTRVLVGPYADTQALGKAKTDLENAGFRPVRYKP
jgi:hypothetical protein